MLPHQFKLLTWVVVSKKRLYRESPNPLHVLWHGVIKGVRQRNVTTCKNIAVLPPLPALGRFNEAKMVKAKPNIF